jgi:hypothetical protein
MNKSEELLDPDFQILVIGAIAKILELQPSSEDRIYYSTDNESDFLLKKKNEQKYKEAFSHEEDCDEDLFFQKLEKVLLEESIASFILRMFYLRTVERSELKKMMEHEQEREKREKLDGFDECMFRGINTLSDEELEEYSHKFPILSPRLQPRISYSKIPFSTSYLNHIRSQEDHVDNILIMTLINLTVEIYNKKLIKDVPLPEFLRTKGILNRYAKNLDQKELVRINPYFKNRNFFKAKKKWASNEWIHFPDSDWQRTLRFVVIFFAHFEKMGISRKRFYEEIAKHLRIAVDERVKETKAYDNLLKIKKLFYLENHIPHSASRKSL